MNIEDFISKLKFMCEFDEKELRELVSEASPDELDKEYKEVLNQVFSIIEKGIKR